jgi:hypothetical protein
MAVADVWCGAEAACAIGTAANDKAAIEPAIAIVRDLIGSSCDV